jgi:hypothetical protein
MRGLTAIGAGDGLDVIRPAPARLKRGPADNAVSDPHQLDATFVSHRPNLIR